MKKLNSYMGPFSKWLNRWRLRRIIVALETQSDTNQYVHDFAKSLEATEIMTRGGKKDAECLITVERAQLDAFIRYMCSLHDSKLSRITLARVGLACLMLRDEKTLKAPPREVLKEAKSSGGKETIKQISKQLELKL